MKTSQPEERRHLDREVPPAMRPIFDMLRAWDRKDDQNAQRIALERRVQAARSVA